GLLQSGNSPEAVLRIFSHSNYPGVEKQVADKIQNLVKDVQDHPDSADAWGKLGMNLDVHDWKNEAVICYGKAASLNPSEFRWPYYSAMILSDLGSPEALTLFQKAITIKPNELAAHLRYAQALFTAGKLDEARGQFQKAAEIDPTEAHAFLGLGRIALLRNDLKGSIGYFLQAQKLNPRLGEVHGLLSDAYRR